VLNTFGTLAFLRALRVGKVSLVSPIASGYAAVLVLASLLILGERLSPTQAAGVLLVLVGSLVASTDFSALRDPHRPTLSDPGLPWAFGAMFGWGFGYFFVVESSRVTGWAATSLTGAVVQLLLIVGVAIAGGRSLAPPPTRRLWALTVGAAATGWLSSVVYTIGVETHMAAIIAPVSAAFPVVTLLLARSFLHERLTPHQWSGIAVVVAGVVLVTLV
jgi:uncharacterized membrane protein